MRIIFHFLSFFFFFLLFLVVSHPLTTPSTFAQNPCPQSHPYLCDGIGPAGEEVCSAEVDCSTNNITVGSTSGPDCRQSPGYCETLSPSCPSGGGGGTVTCNPNTGWCETVSCSQGLDPSSQRYESNRQIYETRSNPVDIVIGEPGDPGGAASNENCGGFYSLTNAAGLNFGDPECEYATNEIQFKDDLYLLLKQLDPVNVDFWFAQIVPCESNYNPNAYASHASIGTPDPAGAWGLFQMGSSVNGPTTPGNGRNGPYDRGDVPWRTQARNAVEYNQSVIGNSFAYWACAR